MKKWLLIASFATLIGCHSSRVTPISVDEDAYKYVMGFRKDAEFFGVDPNIINDSIDSIRFYPLRGDILGLYHGENRHILINHAIREDSLVMKKVMYHELGHLYGLPHDMGGIMGTGYSINQLRSVYSNSDNWDLHKAYLFLRIKEHLEKLE